LQPVFKNIENSLATIDGRLVTDGSEALSSDKTEKTRKRRRYDSPAPPSLVSIDLIQDLVSVSLSYWDNNVQVLIGTAQCFISKMH